MKKLLLSLLSVGMLYTASAQTFNFQDWKVYKANSGDLYVYTGGKGIKNTNKNPDFTIQIVNDEKGTIKIRLDGAYLYSYDSSGNANRVEIDAIVDRGDMRSWTGAIVGVDNENKSRVYFKRKQGEPSYFDLFGDMKSGKNLFIRTTGSQAPKVFKFSLLGFTAALNKMNELYNQRSGNPFDTPESDDPFNR